LKGWRFTSTTLAGLNTSGTDGKGDGRDSRSWRSAGVPRRRCRRRRVIDDKFRTRTDWRPSTSSPAGPGHSRPAHLLQPARVEPRSPK